jgi:hypothetical protein
MVTENYNSAIVSCSFLLAKRSNSSLAFKTDTNRSLYALEFRCSFAVIQDCMGLNLCG